MKRLALVLIAACGGGSAATQSGTTPTTHGASTEEDWRGYLGQLAGSPCSWIPGASFLACIQPAGDPTTTLIGWEPNNRRYVAWRFSPDGRVAVLPGTASNAGWTFEGPDGSINFTRTGDGTWEATGLAQATVSVLADPKTAPPPVAPPQRTEPWRDFIERFSGTWTFSGTERGAQAVRQIECTWIPASTFLACKDASRDGFDLLGYELHSGRYVTYRFTPAAIDVLVGTREGKNWTFASASQRISYTHDTAIRRGYKEEAGGQIVADGTLETSVE